MPRKAAQKKASPPRLPKSRRENGLPAERPRRAGEDEVIAERRIKAFGLRKAGASYRQIAQQLNVGVNTAWADVNAELMELRAQTTADAEAVREMELQRCDEMILGLWPGVRRGDPKSVMAAVRVSDRRARLLGLDAPSKSEITGNLEIDHAHARETLSSRIARLSSRIGEVSVVSEPQ
jgi:DNA-binding CsgD family transcriptional regulator